MLVSLVYAQEPSYVFKRGENIDLKIICMNGDNSCTNAATCNLSVNYPNMSYLLNNKQMTNNGGYFNYSLGQLDVLGVYPSAVKCVDSTQTHFTSFNFEVTDNGQSAGDYSFIFALGFITIFLLLIALFFQIDDMFALGLRITCMLFAILFALMIPAYFTTIDVKLIFWNTFIGFLVTIGVILGLWGFVSALRGWGVIGAKK